VTDSLRLDWGAASDPGRLRPGNEDSAVAEEGLFAVADGMGGHAGGEVASRLAVEVVRANVGADGLVESVLRANQAILVRAQEEPALRGMGTTLCAIALLDDDGPRMEIVNVGDSRVYLFRDGALEQITEDHNFVAELERDGRITAEEAKVHPQRNIITRVLGNDPDVEVDVFRVDPFRGDRFLLCSDGLFNEMADDGIAAVLRAERAPQAAAEELVRRANASGGRDNITVVIVDVVEDGDRARHASAALAGAAATRAAAPVGTITGTIDEPIVDHDRTSARGATLTVEPERHRRITWRAALFVLAVLLVLGAAGGSVWFIGRSTYYVGVDGERVTIFKGRPGGVLWIEPTVERRDDLTIDEVPSSARDAVRAGKEESSLARAERYVANLRARATTTTTTTSTTTTTTPPVFFPGTTPPPSTP
jgi:protein phosphatase